MLRPCFFSIWFNYYKAGKMKLAVIGFGQAGGKITDQFLKYDIDRDLGIVEDALAVNSAKADLKGLEYVPERRRVLIGAEEVKGHGVGADNELGKKIAENDFDVILNELNDLRVHEVDAFLIIAGLGGGTGSGGAPVLARELRKRYEEPVYGLGVLPSSSEGGIYTMNASRSLKTFIDQVDSLLLFDNDEWRESGESVAEGYGTLNSELVSRLAVLFGAGIVDTSSQVAESVVDSSEVINTLDCGGIATIGYASQDVEVDNGLLSRFRESENEEDDSELVNRITSVTRQASLGRLTMPADVSSAKRALVVVAGPPEKLNRKGIERARQWVEDEAETMEVRGGDYPVNTDKVAVVVLFSGITDSQRVRELQETAVEAKSNIDDLRSQSKEDLSEIAKQEEDIDSLF